jgi:hypothetical protein
MPASAYICARVSRGTLTNPLQALLEFGDEPAPSKQSVSVVSSVRQTCAQDMSAKTNPSRSTISPTSIDTG